MLRAGVGGLVRQDEQKTLERALEVVELDAGETPLAERAVVVRRVGERERKLALGIPPSLPPAMEESEVVVRIHLFRGRRAVENGLEVHFRLVEAPRLHLR